MYVIVCMYTYLSIYMYTYTCTHRYVYICKNICKYLHMQQYLHMSRNCRHCRPKSGVIRATEWVMLYTHIYNVYTYMYMSRIYIYVPHRYTHIIYVYVPHRYSHIYNVYTYMYMSVNYGDTALLILVSSGRQSRSTGFRAVARICSRPRGPLNYQSKIRINIMIHSYSPQMLLSSQIHSIRIYVYI